MDKLVSVIMSTYNENIDELRSSIFSILNQTYSNLEFIIVNDNPSNTEIHSFLQGLDDHRIKLLFNTENKGLVYSLNHAIKQSSGIYIARMDADDIAFPDRIERQLDHLLQNDLDMVGCYIRVIDENEEIIINELRFPTEHKRISHFMKWGNCIPHPTWLVRREVFDRLGGYLDYKSCEDYEFILRVLENKSYKVGNAPFVGLKYRIRSNSVSASTEGEQYVLRRYISKNRKKIQTLSEYALKYRQSDTFKKEVEEYENYKTIKKEWQDKKTVKAILRVFLNKYTYICKYEEYQNRKRTQQ